MENSLYFLLLLLLLWEFHAFHITPLQRQSSKCKCYESSAIWCMSRPWHAGWYVLPTAYHLVAHGNTACRYNNSFRPALGACCMFMTMLLTTSYLSKTGKHKVILKIKPKSKVKCYYEINFSFLRLFLPSLPLPTPLCVCMYVCAHMHFLMDVLWDCSTTIYKG